MSFWRHSLQLRQLPPIFAERRQLGGGAPREQGWGGNGSRDSMFTKGGDWQENRLPENCGSTLKLLDSP